MGLWRALWNQALVPTWLPPAFQEAGPADRWRPLHSPQSSLTSSWLSLSPDSITSLMGSHATGFSPWSTCEPGLGWSPAFALWLPACWWASSGSLASPTVVWFPETLPPRMAVFEAYVLEACPVLVAHLHPDVPGDKHLLTPSLQWCYV